MSLIAYAGFDDASTARLAAAASSASVGTSCAARRPAPALADTGDRRSAASISATETLPSVACATAMISSSV